MQQHTKEFTNVLIFIVTFIHLARNWEDYSKMNISDNEMFDLINSVSHMINSSEQEKAIRAVIDNALGIFRTDWSIGINQMLNKAAILDKPERHRLKELMITRINNDYPPSAGISKAKGVLETM